MSYENPLTARLGREFFASLPKKPGIYFMYGTQGELLYIGKAKSLRARLADYRHARTGSVPERTIELIESIAEIRYEPARTEQAARLKELELIRAARPPFNIAHAEGEDYLFIAFRPTEKGVDFQLASHARIPAHEIHGCFRHRGHTKTGYTALLRLIHAALNTRPRFSFPARLTRSSPPYLYSSPFPAEWLPALRHFLSGRNCEFLRQLLAKLLHNETIPPFMYGPIQDDFERARVFFRVGPKANRKLKKRGLITHEELDALIIAGGIPGRSPEAQGEPDRGASRSGASQFDRS